MHSYFYVTYTQEYIFPFMRKNETFPSQIKLCYYMLVVLPAA